MSKKHLVEKLQFAQLRIRLADQIAHFHPGLRKTLLNNLSELAAAITLARSVQLAAIGAKLPVDTEEESHEQWVSHFPRQEQQAFAHPSPSCRCSCCRQVQQRALRDISCDAPKKQTQVVIQTTDAKRGARVYVQRLETEQSQ